MADSPEHAVIAVFDDVPQAEQAARDLMGWDKANEDIKLGAIGLLTRAGGDWGEGEIKTKNLSSRNTGKGAKVGLGLGALAAVLSGGLTLIPTAVGGAVPGAAVGSLSRKGLGLSEQDTEQLLKDLEFEHAALLVMCDADEVTAIAEYLTAAGGRPESHVIDEANLQAAAEAAAAAPPAPPTSSP